MSYVISNDGTTIAYERIGAGPAVILIDGALGYRAFMGSCPLADALSDACSVITYDRRGRGESSDTLPYAVEREIEDIEALIDVVGGSVSLFGQSSGAALVLEAAIKLGAKATRLALYEPPYNDDPNAQQTWNAYITRLNQALAAGRNDDAVALFMALTGASAEDIAAVRQDPMWAGFAKVAPTLAYDHSALLGEYAAVPIELASRIQTPALMLCGGDSYPFMQVTARALSQALPRAQLRILDGQTHEVNPEVLAPILAEFFMAPDDAHKG